MLIACNRSAIDSDKRARYDELVALLRSSIRDRRAVSGGYVFDIDAGQMSPSLVDEWMEMERLCCPFLQIEVGPPLQITGPEGIDDLLNAEFYSSGGGYVTSKPITS